MAPVYLPQEIQFRGPIPDDLTQTGVEGELLSWYDPYRAIDRRTKQDLSNNGALIRILQNTDIDILLKTLGNAFFPRTIQVQTTPTILIQPNRYPRGYVLINPNTTVSGVVTNVTVFPAGTVFPVGTTNSASINVSGHGAATFIMDITEGSAGPVTVALQTQDPISGNWVTAQGDIFGGAAAIGTYFAHVGAIGIDNNARLQVAVAGDTMTASIAAILKPALAGTIAGPTIFMGNEDVTTVLGYPLLSGQKDTWYLKENTPLFGIAVAVTELRLFELQ